MFFSSIEFYVIMAIVAAAIVAMAARPRTRGEVKEFLLASRLSNEGDPCGTAAGYGDWADTRVDTAVTDEPAIEFRCLHSGDVHLVRSGLSGIYMSGAVSLAVKFDGMNLMIEERLVEGSTWDAEARTAVFDIDFLAPGRYHVRYNSQKTGLFCAFQLHVRPGLVATRLLTR